MRRSWLIVGAIALAVAVVVAVVAVVLVRDSDSQSSPSSTTQWAGEVCTSLSKWRTSISSLANVSGATLDRDALREKLTDAQVATEQLITDLKNLGPPETTSGTQLKQQLETQGDKLEQSYENLKAGAQNALEASSTVDFLQRLAKLAPDLQKLLNEVSTTIDTLQSSDVAGASADEVKEGFENADSCKKLRSQQD